MSAGAVAAVVSLGMATIVAGLVVQAIAHRKTPRWWSHSLSYLGFAISGGLSGERCFRPDTPGASLVRRVGV